MRFIRQKERFFRVGIRDGWLVVSQHFEGRLFKARPVLLVGKIGDKDLEMLCMNIDLAELVKDEILNELRRA